jgi:hypothetical protein
MSNTKTVKKRSGHCSLNFPPTSKSAQMSILKAFSCLSITVEKVTKSSAMTRYPAAANKFIKICEILLARL